MRKYGILILLIVLVLLLSACTKDIEPKLELKVEMDITPIQTYGNQINQQKQGDEAVTFFFKDGDWVYATRFDRIVKFSIHAPEKEVAIYNFEGDEGCPSDISVLGGWIYFILEENDSQSNLYKIKKDGSEKTMLANYVASYILTKKEIYYESYEKSINSEELAENPKIYVTSFDGKHERTLPGENQSLCGIDDGWVYYEKTSNDDYALYRVRPNGKDRQAIFVADTKVTLDAAAYCVIEDNQVFLTRSDGEKTLIIKGKIDGEETLLTAVPEPNRIDTPMNKVGNWLYYAEKNKVYKINVMEKGRKQLVYQFENGEQGDVKYVNSILIYHDGILLSAFEKRVFIKNDGTVIDID